MKQSLMIIPLVLLILLNPISICANFFQNITSIPASLIPNATIWDSFNQLLGSHNGQTPKGLSKIKKYFQQFGYLNSSYSDFSDTFDDSLESAVKMYQINFNLNATGELDAPTLQHVVQPRCGNPDIVNGTSTMNYGKPVNSTTTIHTVAHYSFFPGSPRWPANKYQLTYAFAPANQLTDIVKSVFSRAFDRWAEVSPFTFTETASFTSADITIAFAVSEHGDDNPFDGMLGTLAHAFAPQVGMLHMDADENWVLDGDFLNNLIPYSAVDLESVVVHEIGHILGLGHSSSEDAIMYPSLSSGVRKVELANDDVMGVQDLYGSNPGVTGSEPVLTPRQERDTNGAGVDPVWGRGGCMWIVGLLSSLFLI